jgi:aspartate aminotransferase
MKTPVDDREFVQAAKEYNILIVPGSSFACPGYVRIAYCVAKSTIVNSMDGFGKLAEKYGLKKV